MPSSGPASDAGTDAQARLRKALAKALRRRDAIAVSALRSALSAIGNAEAVTAPAATSTTSTHIAGSAAGLGAAETRRRELSEAEVSRILQAEISERLAAARGYDASGHPDRAQGLRQEARVLTTATARDVLPGHQPGADVTIWYNPLCSKCRGAEELLAAHGVPAQRVFYLDEPPARTEITRVLGLLGTADPRVLIRTSEPRYQELGLTSATADELLEAMASYPELIQRPVVIWADRAVIARPAELLLPLLETGGDLAGSADDRDPGC
jgi:arsenate reductase (glutaredoxin)